MTYKKDFINRSSISMGGHVLIYLKGIILMPLIIKTVGAGIYGGFTLLVTLFGFLFGVSSLGMGFNMRRHFPAFSADDRRKIFFPQFYFQLLVLLVICGLWFLGRGGLDHYFLKGEIRYSFWIIPAYFLAYFLFSQGTDYWRYTNRVGLMTLGTTSFPYLHIAFVLALCALALMSVNWLVLSMALSAFLIAIPAVVMIVRELGWRFSFFDRKGFVESFKIGFPTVLNYVVDFILSGSDRFVIAFFMGVTSVGYYSPAYMMGSLIILIPKALGCVVPQMVSKAYDEGRMDEVQRILNDSMKLFLIFGIPFVLGSFVVAKPLLRLFANAQVAGAAGAVVPVVAMAMIFYGLNLILMNILYVHKETGMMFKFNAAAAGLNLIANIVFLYFFRNITVAAWTTLLSYALVFVVLRTYVKKTWGRA